MREVDCAKLNKKAPGLSRPPLPGRIGKELYDNISQEAWDMWLSQQTILINEYRLNPLENSARDMLEEQMRAFLFEDKDVIPNGLDITS